MEKYLLKCNFDGGKCFLGQVGWSRVHSIRVIAHYFLMNASIVIARTLRARLNLRRRIVAIMNLRGHPTKYSGTLFERTCKCDTWYQHRRTEPEGRGIGKADTPPSQDIHTLYLSTFFPKTIFTLPTM